MLTMPTELHTETAEDGYNRLHPGYFVMQCPCCKKQFVVGKPGFGELRAISGALNCGRLVCNREMGLGDV